MSVTISHTRPDCLRYKCGIMQFLNSYKKRSNYFHYGHPKHLPNINNKNNSDMTWCMFTNKSQVPAGLWTNCHYLQNNHYLVDIQCSLQFLFLNFTVFYCRDIFVFVLSSIPALTSLVFPGNVIVLLVKSYCSVILRENAFDRIWFHCFTLYSKIDMVTKLWQKRSEENESNKRYRLLHCLLQDGLLWPNFPVQPPIVMGRDWSLFNICHPIRQLNMIEQGKTGDFWDSESIGAYPHKVEFVSNFL